MYKHIKNLQKMCLIQLINLKMQNDFSYNLLSPLPFRREWPGAFLGCRDSLWTLSETLQEHCIWGHKMICLQYYLYLQLYGCNVKPIHVATGTCRGTVSFTQSKRHDILQNILNQITNSLALPSLILRDLFQYSAIFFCFQSFWHSVTDHYCF